MGRGKEKKKKKACQKSSGINTESSFGVSPSDVPPLSPNSSLCLYSKPKRFVEFALSGLLYEKNFTQASHKNGKKDYAKL